MQKLLIMGPNNTKNSSKSVIFSESRFYCKKTPNLIKRLFLFFTSKPRVGPINSWHNTFKWGNIFASICALVLSLCYKYYNIVLIFLIPLLVFWSLIILKRASLLRFQSKTSFQIIILRFQAQRRRIWCHRYITFLCVTVSFA